MIQLINLHAQQQYYQKGINSVNLRFYKYIWSIYFFILLFGAHAQTQSDTITSAEVASLQLRQLALSNPEYTVCAGDIYNLSYNAAGQAVNYTIQLDTSYILKVSNLASINVSGKKFTYVKKLVEDIVTKNYPFSGVQFTLITPAQFTVRIQGEVTAVSEVISWGGQRLSELVNTIGTQYSSKRNIEVYSADGTSARYDLFQAQRYGDMTQDPFLRPGDTVVLRRYDRKVTITGAVERPGEYELTEGENLEELINYYGGGLDEFADLDKISLSRMIESAQESIKEPDSIGQIIYLQKKDIHKDGKFVLTLENLDYITIGSKLSQQPVFFIEGAVSVGDIEPDETDETTDGRTNRVAVSFIEGTDYATVIRKHTDLLALNADLQNAYVLRTGESLPLNIESVLYDKEYLSGIQVQRNDTLIIPFRMTTGRDDEKNSFPVTIKGEVSSVQEKTALWGKTRLSTIIEDCLTPYSSKRNIEVYSADGTSARYDLFQAQRYGDMTQDPFLRPGDTVVLRRYDRKVTITGAVERPGEYELTEGENLEELINYYGGGLDEFADLDKISLLRLNIPEDYTSGTGNYIYLDYKSIYVDNRFEFILYDHDTVFIDSLLRLKPVLFVEGAVRQTEADSAAEVVEEAASRKTIIPFTAGEDYGDIMRRISTFFSSESDLKNAYIIRESEIIPLNIEDLVYHKTEKANITANPFDTVIIPFRLYYVTVTGAVNAPGRYPYVPDKNWEYYTGLAGGFTEQNSFQKVTIQGPDGNKKTKDDIILPETIITAERNGFIYNFNRFAGPVTTLLSIATTVLMFLNLSN